MYKKICLMLLFFLGLLFISVWAQQNIKSSTNISCLENNCSCCLETANCDISVGLCDDQCIHGYHGGRCKNICPSRCLSCNDADSTSTNSSLWSTAKCRECKPGYFSTSDLFQCQFNCSAGCATCTSATDCTSCMTGYYQLETACSQCPSECASCITFNQCTQCNDGFYISVDVVEYRNCTPCSEGCWNKLCNNESGECNCTSSNYTGDKCNQCAPNIQTYPICDQCVAGFYGTDCKQDCSVNCKDKVCDRHTGNCTYGCSDNFSGDNCTLCKDGWYGQTCDKECPDNCYGGFCNQSNGYCHSCKNNFTGETCASCINGKYGINCDFSCPSNCKDSICNRTTGNCNSCNNSFTGDRCCLESSGCQFCLSDFECSECVPGKHGENCEMDCPVNCADKICVKVNGTCITCADGFQGDNCTLASTVLACKTNFTGESCDSCKNGQYGINCDYSCPSNCTDSGCNRTTGNCYSCKSGLSGDRCCMQGMGCQSCSWDDICTECTPGKHGDLCGKECPENCANIICNKTNGTCITCKDGFQGGNCTTSSRKKAPGPGVSVAAIAGGLTGGSVVIIAVVVLLVIFVKRRSSNTTHHPKTMADDLTTDRVYVNDASIISAFNTYNTETNTYDTIRDLETTSFGASLTKGEVRPITTKKHEVINKLDSSMKSDAAVKKIKTPKQDKSLKPEMAKKPCKQQKAATSKLPQQPVVTIEDEFDNDYYNTQACLENSVPVIDLAVYVGQKDSEFFSTEFAKLPKGLVKSTEIAMLDLNRGKNRYNAIYPYDETRVVLEEPGSDFINASYIEGYRKNRKYIASFGPIARATEGFQTFWRLVWQEKTEKIVMVTNLMENGGMKCEQYWPDKNVTMAYGDVRVTCHSEDVYAEYTFRNFTILMGKEKRSLNHIHYTAWPDKGVPDDITSLVEFRNKVNSTKTKLNGPIIIHCSAGVGRTGTYIALDILTRRGKQKGVVNIFDCVKKLRQQRTLMVQTVEQYEYLHRALVHTLSLGSETIPADRFIAYTASLSDAVFDRLSHCTEKASDEETEAIARNKAYITYNRLGADIPGDINRPRLYYGRTTEDNDYINALFVNSFKRKNQFILTQTPLTNTVDDFLTLVLQENCCCIVSMDAPDVCDTTIGTYLPADNQTLSTDAFEVRSTRLDSNQSYTHRTLNISSTSSTITVQHFLCANWSDQAKTPESPQEFLTLVKQIKKVAEETTQFSLVIVHCRTGSERSALLCVVLSLLQKIEIEYEVSVINIVRQVKLRRSKSIPNKEQFKFCHQCVSAYLQWFDTYSNFS